MQEILYSIPGMTRMEMVTALVPIQDLFKSDFTIFEEVIIVMRP